MTPSLPLLGIIFGVALLRTTAALADDKPRFDVASIKASTESVLLQGFNGAQAIEVTQALRILVSQPMGAGLRMASPGFFRTTHTSLRTLVAMAFGVPYDQVRGSEWMNELFFDIDAKAPPDTTPVQAQAMLAELLKERFGLVSHPEMTVKPGYVLKVGKNGPRLKRSELADPQSTDQRDGKAPMKPRGSVPAGDPGTATFRMPGVTMEKVADAFAKWLSAPVEDATALGGKFDVELRFSGHDEESGVSAAQQVGLVLTRSRVPVTGVFVDDIRRAPVEN